MIHIIRNIKYSLRDTLKNILKAFISSFGILFLISFLVLYVSFRNSIKNYIDKSLFGKLSINQVRITPKSNKDTLSFANSSIGGASIKKRQVKKIRKMKELRDVMSVIRMNLPSKVRVELFGIKRRMFSPICGIDPGYFRGKMKNWRNFINKDPVPVIGPAFFLQIANNYLSLKGFPILTAKTLEELPIRLDIYTDFANRKEVKVKAVVHGFSDILTFPGVLVPSDFIVKFTQKIKKTQDKKWQGYHYIIMYAKVKNIKDIPAITKKLNKMGLKVESQRDIANKTNKVMNIIDSSSIFILSIFLILTVISIFNSYLTIVYNRSHKFSLKRVLGVSKIRIIIGFVLESACIGALYGIIGFYVGIYLLSYLSNNISDWIPGLSGILLLPGESNLFQIAIMLSVLVSSVSALIPAIFASNINLFKAVRK